MPGNSRPLPIESVRRIGIGQMMVKFQSMYVVRDAISGRVLPMFADIVFTLVILSSVLTVSVIHAGVIILLGFTLVALLTLTSNLAVRLSQNVIDSSSIAHGTLTESVVNFSSVKILGIEDNRKKKWHNEYLESLLAIFQRRNLDVYLDSFLGIISSIYPLLWLGLSMMILSKGGDLTVGGIVTLISLCGFAMSPIQRIAGSVQGLLGVSAEFDNIQDVLSTTPENTNPNGKQIVSLGGIRVRNATLTATGNKPIATSLTLGIPGGSFTAIIGSSGIGKTTFLNALLGMNRDVLAAISIDGVPLSEYNLQALRSQIGYLDQNPALFTGTIRDNIAMGRPSISDSDIIEALEAAGLGTTLSSLPLGLSTVLTSDGSGLSGGQAQRLCLARAIVTKPPILLLDEPTANLDVETEAEIFETIASFDATRIVVTHELNVKHVADNVVELTPAGFAPRHVLT
ncbi:MAG: ATP-binding cassette domain-containing protein [Corynebacterium sp.]|nr:ATP-binding cassette domain-containing protein [Corynebacterium sp.]